MLEKMKKPHPIIRTIATDVVRNIIKSCKKQPTKYERESAVRGACDLVRLLLGRLDWPTRYSVEATYEALTLAGDSQVYEYGTQSDFEAFARLAENSGLTSRWVKGRKCSSMRFRQKLLDRFNAAMVQAVGRLANYELALLLAPKFGFGKTASQALERKLVCYPLNGVNKEDSASASTALLDAITPHVGYVPAQGFALKFLHVTKDTMRFTPAYSGNTHEVKCSTAAFQRIVMNACLKHWLAIDTMSSELTAFRGGSHLERMVCDSIGQSANARMLLAAHVIPMHFLDNPAKYGRLPQ